MPAAPHAWPAGPQAGATAGEAWGQVLGRDVVQGAAVQGPPLTRAEIIELMRDTLPGLGNSAARIVLVSSAFRPLWWYANIVGAGGGDGDDSTTQSSSSGMTSGLNQALTALSLQPAQPAKYREVYSNDDDADAMVRLPPHCRSCHSH